MKPVEAAWLSLAGRVSITLEEFISKVSNMEMHPVFVGKQIAGALFVSAAEIHACILPEYKGRWLSRKELRVMNSVIKKHGYAQSSATTEQGKAFLQRLGFFGTGIHFVRYKPWA